MIPICRSRRESWFEWCKFLSCLALWLRLTDPTRGSELESSGQCVGVSRRGFVDGWLGCLESQALTHLGRGWAYPGKADPSPWVASPSKTKEFWCFELVSLEAWLFIPLGLAECRVPFVATKPRAHWAGCFPESSLGDRHHPVFILSSFSSVAHSSGGKLSTTAESGRHSNADDISAGHSRAGELW